jgi:hypothetical protein
VVFGNFQNFRIAVLSDTILSEVVELSDCILSEPVLSEGLFECFSKTVIFKFV